MLLPIELPEILRMVPMIIRNSQGWTPSPARRMPFPPLCFHKNAVGCDAESVCDAHNGWKAQFRGTAFDMGNVG